MTNPQDPWSADPSVQPPPPETPPYAPWENPQPPEVPPASAWQQPPPQDDPATSGWQQSPPFGTPPYLPGQQSARPGTPAAGWHAPSTGGGAPYGYGPSTSGPGLGAGAFALVVCMTVATVVLGALAGHDLGVLMLEVGSTTVDATQIRATDPALTQRLSTWLVLSLIASLVGIGGWIAAIVAVNRRSARPLAITALVIGVIAPVLGIATMIAAAVPLLSQIPQ